MKVHLEKDGTLIVTAENGLESYALDVWHDHVTMEFMESAYPCGFAIVMHNEPNKEDSDEH